MLMDMLHTCYMHVYVRAQAIPHVSAWKGSDHSNTWSLLARLWRAEEWDMEVPRGYKNTLAGIVMAIHTIAIATLHMASCMID